MGRIVFTTCGTSALSSGCWQIPGASSQSLCGAIGAELRKKQAWNEANVLAFSDKHRSAQDLASTIDSKLLTEENIGRIRDLPAEVASLMALDYLLRNSQQPPYPLGAKDLILLLHSKDADGTYCAEVVKLVLDAYLQSRDVARLEDVEYIDPDDFRPGMKKMSSRCKDIVLGNPGYDFIFNLTGGFKAMGITMASLGTSLHEQASVRACYLHEATDYSRLSTGLFGPHGIEWIDWSMFRPPSRVRDIFESR